MDISLVVDQSDTVLDEVGFSLVDMCRKRWPDLRATGVAYEPVSGCVMLEPDLRPRDMRLAEYRTGPGSYAEFASPALGSARAVVQTNVYPSGTPWLESYRHYPRNQGFVVHFYIYEPPPAVGHLACLTLWFGGRYRLRVTDDGAANLERAEGRLWEHGREPAFSYTGDSYAPMASGQVVAGGAMLANRWHRLIVLPLKSDTILVKGGDALGFAATEPDVLTVGAGPTAEHWTTFAAPVRVGVVGGAFVVSVSCPAFATSGTLESPLVRLGYSAAQLPQAEVRYEPRSGVSAGLTLLAEPGGAPLSVPADRFAYRLDLGGRDSAPTVVYDARIRFGPTTRERAATAVDVSPYVLELRERAALSESSTRLDAVIDNTDGVLDGKLARCNMRVALAVAGERRFTGLSGLSELAPGHARTVALECEDGWKRLRSARLASAPAYDGMPHTEVVASLLRHAGFADDEMVIAPDDFALPSSVDDDDPLFQPRCGETVAAFLEYVRESFSGWRMHFDRFGAFHYEPPDTGAQPKAAFTTVTLPDGLAEPVHRLADAIDETGHANEVYVVGLGRDGQPITACFVDHASQEDPACERYVGERRLLVWVDTALATESAVAWVCRTLAEEAIWFRRRVVMESTFRPDVFPGDVVLLDGEALLVTGMDTVLMPAVGRTRYTLRPS